MTLSTNGNGKHLLDVRDLKKVYGSGTEALKGINLTVESGEFIVVVGKSGAGKSTLVNLLTGIDKPSAGQIMAGDTAIHALNEDQMARWRGENMGIVFQFFQLLPSLTLIQNITIAMDFCNTFPLKEREERALHLLDQVGIAEHAHKTPSKISGGQQQRVAIARALANDPDIIVADEPTGNLDSRTTYDVLKVFEETVERGKTLLLVTHDEEIAARATRIIEIADGVIISDN